MLFFMIINTTKVQSQNQSGQEMVYVKIEVKGLSCPYCAFGMEKKLKNISGVNEVEIELKEGMVYISMPKAQQPEKKELSKIIKDAGYTVGKITFSDKPFSKKASA